MFIKNQNTLARRNMCEWWRGKQKTDLQNITFHATSLSWLQEHDVAFRTMRRTERSFKNQGEKMQPSNKSDVSAVKRKPGDFNVKWLRYINSGTWYSHTDNAIDYRLPYPSLSHGLKICQPCATKHSLESACPKTIKPQTGLSYKKNSTICLSAFLTSC